MAKGFKTGGRKAGTPNRVTHDVRALANGYCAEAISTLIDLMRHGGEQVRLAASRELLDRAIGRPTQRAEVSATLEPAPADYKAMSDDELWAIVYAGRPDRDANRPDQGKTN